MFMQYVVNQDRDKIIPLDVNCIIGHSVMHEGQLIGFNLMMNDILLGTFDSPGELVKEIEKIISFKEEVFIVDKLV